METLSICRLAPVQLVSKLVYFCPDLSSLCTFSCIVSTVVVL